MEVKTKFNVGDVVYFIFNNELHQGIISSVSVFSEKRYVRTSYRVCMFDDIDGVVVLKTEFSKNNLFDSVDDLCATLKDIQFDDTELEKCKNFATGVY